MKTCKNPISTAMAEYREDFRYNKEWWTERMGAGRNNEYLWIQFKNGDSITVQSDYFQLDGNTCLPRFRADEVAYISRYYGDDIETTTAADIVVDTDRIILYRDGVEYFRCEMTEEEFKEMRRQMWELDDETDLTAWTLDYCRAFAASKMNNNTTTSEPNNTPSTMNANEPELTAKQAAYYNAMLTLSEEPASLAWESEPKTDEELTALGVDAFGDNMNANEIDARRAANEFPNDTTGIVSTGATEYANETTANDLRESVSRLRYELQQYHDNASKGGSERRRNMILLRWDIRKLERRLTAI